MQPLFFVSLLLLSSSSLCHFLLCFSFLGVILELISAVSARAQQRSTEPAFGRLFTQMTVKFVTFLKKKTAAVRCFQLRKKVLRLDATSYQSSDRTVQHLCLWLQNEHEWHSLLTQGGRMTMMPMPVNRITSQCKIKLSQKYCPWINLQLCNFCHFFLQWVGSFFLIIMFCSAIHVYLFIHVQIGSQTWASPSFVLPILAKVRIPPRAAARAHFLVIKKGAGQFYLSFNTR